MSGKGLARVLRGTPFLGCAKSPYEETEDPRGGLQLLDGSGNVCPIEVYRRFYTAAPDMHRTRLS